jgi:hypothetical protein
MILVIRPSDKWWVGHLRTPGGQTIEAFGDSIQEIISKICDRMKDKGVVGQFEVKFEVRV